MSSNKDFANSAPGAVGYDADHPAAAHLPILNAETAEVGLAGRKKIAICGFASSSRHLIPTDDPTWIIAGLNQLYRHMPRADAWFEIHINWDEHNVDGTDHGGWLRDCGIPVYMSKVPDILPKALNYPIDRMIDRFGADYFTSTVSLMIAWAIDGIERDMKLSESPTKYSDYTIGIFGIDLIVGTEYDFQKSCAEFWLGVATGLGITVFIPPQSALLKQSHRYGFQTGPESGVLGMVELRDRVAELAAFKNKTTPIMHGMNGALQALSDLAAKPAIVNSKSASALVYAGIAEAKTKVDQMVAEVQTYDGAMQEAQHHMNVMELRLRGGEVPLLQNMTR